MFPNFGFYILYLSMLFITNKLIYLFLLYNKDAGVGGWYGGMLHFHYHKYASTYTLLHGIFQYMGCGNNYYIIYLENGFNKFTKL